MAKKKNSNQKTIALAIIGAIALIIGTATASAYFTKQNLQPEKQVVAENKVQSKKSSGKIAWDNAPVRTQQVQAAPPPCDDSNIVGTVAGGAAGGIVASQIGKGHGKTAATIGGTLGGAYLGNQYLPTKNVTCR